jgi:hypothetical protein
LFPQEARNKALRFQHIRHFLTPLEIRRILAQTPHFTGVFDPDEEPLKPDLVSFSDSKTPKESARKVLGLLIDSGYLPRETPVPRVPRRGKVAKLVLLSSSRAWISQNTCNR